MTRTIGDHPGAQARAADRSIAIVARRYSQPSADCRVDGRTRPGKRFAARAGRGRRPPPSGPAAIQGACRAGISSSTVAASPSRATTPDDSNSRASGRNVARRRLDSRELDPVRRKLHPRDDAVGQRDGLAPLAADQGHVADPAPPGQSETTPGSIGQKYSVSVETAWSAMLSDDGASGQPVPVVADHLPAADHQRRDHEHDRDPQPDLGQLERRPARRQIGPSSRDALGQSALSEPGASSVIACLPDRRDRTFELRRRHGVVVHVDHPLVILFAVDPDRVAAVDEIADGSARPAASSS